ncbi:MAG: acetyl-CoA C-acyltransferase [Rhodobacteraceae bacterium]|nr:MAG: acetyl-CoA C-acyltransferase [Paracoccaceae bacterium]
MSDNVVIVSTARTPIAKAYRGAFNDTQPQELMGHAIKEAISRANINANEVEDVHVGAALQQGSTGGNIARQSAIRAGLPTSVPGMSIDRQCSSGLMTIASIAGRIKNGEIDIGVAGGVESVSLVQNEKMNTFRAKDPWNVSNRPDLYMSMLETAEVVAERYGVTREDQDKYAADSHLRTANAQSEGRLKAELAPLKTVKKVQDRETKEVTDVEVTLENDEGLRANTTVESLATLQPVFANGQTVEKGNYITAGNASQLSDGAAALVLMSEKMATSKGLEPLGIYRGISVSGCDPDEMGIGPVFAVPELLRKYSLSIEDIDMWELNEAFASQCLYCRDRLGIDPEKYNINGGAIAVGHPYGMSGARMASHILHEGRRTNIKYGVVSMCIGGGMGAAGLFELS